MFGYDHNSRIHLNVERNVVLLSSYAYTKVTYFEFNCFFIQFLSKPKALTFLQRLNINEYHYNQRFNFCAVYT